MFETYEDIQAFYASEGWGCKACGQLSSDAWWKTSGDTYCTSCKQHMWAELRVRFNRVPNRVPGQAPATWEHDPSGFGHEYAADMRDEHKRIYG